MMDRNFVWPAMTDPISEFFSGISSNRAELFLNERACPDGVIQPCVGDMIDRVFLPDEFNRSAALAGLSSILEWAARPAAPDHAVDDVLFNQTQAVEFPECGFGASASFLDTPMLMRKVEMFESLF